MIDTVYVGTVAEISCYCICCLWTGVSQQCYRYAFSTNGRHSHGGTVHCSLFHCIAALCLDHIHLVSTLVQHIVHSGVDGLWDFDVCFYQTLNLN